MITRFRLIPFYLVINFTCSSPLPPPPPSPLMRVTLIHPFTGNYLQFPPDDYLRLFPSSKNDVIKQRRCCRTELKLFISRAQFHGLGVGVSNRYLWAYRWIRLPPLLRERIGCLLVIGDLTDGFRRGE